MSEKSILEQALLQVQNLEEAVKQNAKGILASTMKEELKDLLKESLEEEETYDTMEQPEDDTKPEGEEEKDVTADDEATDDESADDVDTDVDTDTDLDNDETDTEDGDTDSMDDVDADDTDVDDTDVDADDTDSMDDYSADDETSDDDVMDMTGASDDEVLKVFKAMKPEDGIVVKKDGNSVEFGDGEDEYIIKLDGEESPEVDTDVDSDVDEEWNEEEMMPEEDMMSSDNQETIYEIELDEEEEEAMESALKGLSHPKKVEAKETALKGLSHPKKVEAKETALKGLSHPKKVEAKEASRTFANDVRTPADQGKKYKAGRHEMNEEVETLRKQNAEYKKALVLFKDKLNEVAVFNANLAYATRLFTEHTTTKQEKLTILKRFDTVSTMNESKTLFTTIKTELGSKTTVTETVADKISNTPSSSSTGILSESKAYENPQFSRIKEMMRKIN